jgi:predicted transposase/invertase (TIGR01784 family)
MSTRTLISFDYAVKRLLRNKADYEVLEGFLSELFRRQIRIKSILESESNREQDASKQNRVDMLVSDETDELFIIEIQFTNELDYFHRMLFGVSKTLTEHIGKGNTYSEIKKMYSVNIVYFDFGSGRDYVYYGKTHFTGLHENDELQLSPTQRQTFGKVMAGDLFPEYYILKVNTFDDVAKDTLDEWIYYFKNSRIEEGFKAQGLQKAGEILDESRLSPEERKAYEKAVDMRRSDNSSIWTAKIEGRAEGLAEGKVTGKAEGLAEGLAEGERLKTLEIIANSQKAGLPAETIASITGLSLDEVQALMSSWFTT